MTEKTGWFRSLRKNHRFRPPSTVLSAYDALNVGHNDAQTPTQSEKPKQTFKDFDRATSDAWGDDSDDDGLGSMASMSMTSSNSSANRQRAQSDPTKPGSTPQSSSSSGNNGNSAAVVGNRVRSETGPPQLQQTAAEAQRGGAGDAQGSPGRMPRPSRAGSAPVGVPESLLQAYPDPVVAPPKAARRAREEMAAASVGSPPKAVTAIAGPTVAKGKGKGKGGKMPRRKSSSMKMMGFGRRSSNSDMYDMADTASLPTLSSPSPASPSPASRSGSAGSANDGEGAAVEVAPPPQPPQVSPARIKKFKMLLEMQNLDMEALKELSWSGIPQVVRPTTWMLLSGYLPANAGRRERTLEQKRAEYGGFVEQYYPTREDGEENKKTFHQIQIDLPRTSASPLFQAPDVQRILERALYIWSIRHPGSGYVQGMNDLITPFFVVFLTPYVEGNIQELTELAPIDASVLDAVEADTYWCLSKLLDGIQDNYIASQPGIQKKIQQLKDLVSRIDGQLHDHLNKLMVEYLQFSFRWMNCLLMRELPLQCTIRLWDTYHAEPDGFAKFHLYACAAFLATFSKQLLALSEFQDVILMLQKLPTQQWTEREVAVLLAEAYRWKFMFQDAQAHLNDGS